MHKLRIIITHLASLLLASCVYKLDIQQGNVVTQEMVDQLRPNMNKRQVRFVMGTPLEVDPFHPDRWDYIYTNQPAYEDRVEQKITLYFKDDALVSLQGDFRPSGMPPEAPTGETTVIVPKRETDKTFFGKIKSLFDWDDNEQPEPESAAEPVRDALPDAESEPNLE